ncbi:MAG: hypothetical protein WCO05_02355 [Candidatus Moraniibacteriota bacterium]
MHDNKILEELFRYIFNPISGFIFSAVLSWLFYVKKNEGLIRSAPFIIFGIDLIMWVVFPVCVLMSQIFHSQVEEVLFFIVTSFTFTIFYLIVNLKRTSKFLKGVALVLSVDKRSIDEKYKIENIIILYFYVPSILVLFIITNLFVYPYIKVGRGVEWDSVMLLHSLVVVAYISFRKLSIKLYNIPIIFSGFIGLRYMLSVVVHQHFYQHAGRAMIYLSVALALWLNIKYLKYFKAQQLTQNQNEI